MAVTNNDVAEGSVTFAEMLSILLRWKVWVLLVSVVAGAAALTVGIVMPKKYDSVVTAAVASPESSHSLASSVAGSLGGLASLVGVSGGNAEEAEYLAVLRSQILAQRYIVAHGLVETLDPRAGQDTPSSWRATEFFRLKVADVRYKSADSIVTVAVRWKDPKQAADWANGLVEAANDYLRTRALDESDRRIKYLTGEATKAQEVAVRQAIYSVLQTEINTATMARGSREYAFRTLDPAVVAEEPASLSPLVLGIVAFLASIALFAIAAVIRVIW